MVAGTSSIRTVASTTSAMTVAFLRCWTKLYGAVTLEVFGHLRFALEDPSPMFEYTLTEMAAALGLPYPAH